ncbi:MAG: mechanosensitive ion channel [Verrucomicrobiae bacterium]|nr:mechanosensitive ion channel [Verrucomicrobiae bacterium]
MKFLSTLFATLVVLAISAVAQTSDPAPKSAAADELTMASVEKALEETKTDASLDDAAKAGVTKLLEEAVASLQAAEKFATTTAQYQSDFQKGPAEIDRIQKELKARENGKPASEDAKDPTLGPNATPEMLKARLLSEKTRLTELTNQARDWESQLAEMETRPSANQQRVVEATKQLAEADADLIQVNPQTDSTTPPGPPTPREKAARLAIQARQLELKRELEFLAQESLTMELRRSLIEFRSQLADSDLERLQGQVKALESRVDALVSDRISAAEKLVEELGSDQVKNNALLERLVTDTKEFSEKNRSILDQISSADLKLKSTQSELDRLRRDSDNIRAQIEIGGLEDSFAQSLLELRSGIPTSQDFRVRSEARKHEIAAARLAAIRLEREMDGEIPLEDQLSLIENSLRSAELGDEVIAKLKPVLRSLIETRVQLHKDAIEGNRRLSSLLGQVEAVDADKNTKAVALRNYLQEKLIWVASSPPLGFASLNEIAPAFRSLAGPEAMAEYLGVLSRVDFMNWLLLPALAAVFLIPRPRLWKFLDDSAVRTRRISTDGVGMTFRALGATLWLALPGPILLRFLGWIFINDSGGSDIAFALGSGLRFPAGLLLAIRFTSILFRPNGVADAHFRWNRSLLDPCRRALYGMVWIYLPASALLAILLSPNNATYFQEAARLVFIFSLIAFSVILWRLVGRSSRIWSRYENSTHKLIRFRNVWVPLVVGTPLALAVLAGLGHFLTAVMLTFQFQMTVLVIVTGILIYGLLARWVILKERRLALSAALAQREARKQAQKEKKEEGDSQVDQLVDEIVSVEEVEKEVDRATVGTQTRRLIGAVVVVCVTLGCWVIWSEVIPILKYLDTRHLFGQVSIADLISLALIALVTNVVFRNLPGLLEVAFLEALEPEAGVRNAITTICQYVVIAISAAVAFQTVGWDWSQFGWIAAALSVGLGFGLQEVVANFVCGLILLFERPIRVGDIVTIAGVDGVVSKIQIRATTITTWDRKEFVVPNKEFITGTLTNWTLSNAITRLLFPVGVAYGTDTDKVQALLLDIAKSHPSVLEDPGPTAIFEQFGDSTLNFTIRCFVARPEVRLETTHQINTEINRRFAEAGIEIAFPQRDLHLRSIDPGIRLGGGATSSGD